MKVLRLLGFAALTVQALLLSGCGSSSTSDEIPQPIAGVKAEVFVDHGYQRIDNYHWLQNKADPAVIAYLEAENAYTEAMMAPTQGLQNTLFKEIKERQQAVVYEKFPYFSNGYYYYTLKDKEKPYPIQARRKGSMTAPEEVIFDPSKEVLDGGQFFLGKIITSPDSKKIAYTANDTGSAGMTLRFRDLTTGENLPDVLEGISGYDVAWTKDSSMIYYVRLDEETLRPYKLYRHQMGSSKPDELLYEEKDEGVRIELRLSVSGDYVFVSLKTWDEVEVRMISTLKPDAALEMFAPRKAQTIYFVDHHKDKFLVCFSDPSIPNIKIFEAPLQGYLDQSTWKDFLPYDPEMNLESIKLYEGFVLLGVRTNGLVELRVVDIVTKNIKLIPFADPVYYVEMIDEEDYSAKTVRYKYSSLQRSLRLNEYDPVTGSNQTLYQDPMGQNLNPDAYEVKRIWAPASDGVKVPIVLIHQKGMKLDGRNPVLMEAYGSYGENSEAKFDPNRFSLIDRGFVYAIAQVRGGSELGPAWAEAGKLMQRKNSFTDLIACAEELIRQKYTSPQRLALIGGSAGGTLLGAVANMRPELFQAIVAEVPFVDVLNTMLDPSLPLTVGEYSMWGNPTESKEAYEYIRSYSPVDNVRAQSYPHMLVTAGLNDTQVLYHEPAKWVATLRAMKTDKNWLLLRTTMDAGHQGGSEFDDKYRDVAFKYAFLLDRLGVKP